MLKKCAMVAALSLVLLPGTARADWLFTPALGSTFGGDTNGNEHFTYNLSLGWMGAGIVGWEADFGFTPEFFESDDSDFDFDGGNNVVSAMGNVLVGIPVGGQTGGGFRPYVAAGIGMLQTEARTNDDLFALDNSEFGFNLGFGAMGFMTDHVGFRGDIRYLRSFEDPSEDNEFDLGVGNFDYWRGTAGVTFRW
jgi:opacity protein-like surface antigen